MDFAVEINDAKLEITELKMQLNDAIRNGKDDEKHFIQQQIIAIQTRLPILYSLLEKQSTAPIYWLVSGSISNYRQVKGVRSRLYQYADNFLGYHEDSKPCLFYEDDLLVIRVLFGNEEAALHFESNVMQEGVTIGSPTRSLITNCTTRSISNVKLGQRIYTHDYVATDFDLPQECLSTASPSCSLYEQTTDEFRFQRIENLKMFSMYGKAESCHLIPKSLCRNDESLLEYDLDPNNRLAMSRDLHGFFHELNTTVPIIKLSVIDVSQNQVLEGRYRVDIAITMLNQESADMVTYRLNEGSEATSDPLVWRTFVYVLNPVVFKKCLQWKENETQKRWDEFSDMMSAVP